MSQNDTDWSRDVKSTIANSKFGDQNTVILGNVDQSITNIFTRERNAVPRSTTLSVALAIARFVDYSIKLLTYMRDQTSWLEGALSEFSDFKTVTKRLEMLLAYLEGTLKQGREDRSLTSNGKAMQQIASECMPIGTKLVGILKTLTSIRRWKNLETADIASLVSKLQDLRQQLVPPLLGSFREQVESPVQPQRTEDGDRHAIGEVFLSYLGDGEKRQWKEDLISSIRASHNEGDNNVESSTVYTDSETYEYFANLAISRMRFNEIRAREDDIADAYRKTFEWIFYDPKVEQNNWSSFIDWLQSDSSLYWITGKAGSGKSTLMKYIYHDPRTLRLLSTWASDTNLVTAGFFFWNSGTELQMSQLGLMRSLLCQILASKPSLAVSLFPEEWEMYAILGVKPSTFSSFGLKRAFRALKQACACETRLCLFVDGLDEFDGRPMDLVGLLKDIVDCPQIKICTASRPWVEFEEAFRTAPSLRLQDLTKPDITRYVSGKLQEHSMFSGIIKHEKSGRDLVKNITEKASGVFLWVRLVVNSLLDGMTGGEDIEALKERLNSTPSDLEGLFQKILDSIEDSYFGQASRLFQIHRTALEPPSLLAFYFADRFDKSSADTEDTMPMSDEKALFRAEMMARRLNSRCKGLLEIGNPASDLDFQALLTGLSSKSSADGSISRHSVVRYLHRSVKDWLESPEIWAKLLTGAQTPFNARLALSKSFLLQLQTSQQSIEIESFWYLIYSSVFFAWTAEDITQARTTMDELHRVFCKFSDMITKHEPFGPYPAAEIFLNLAVYCNFDFSVETQLRSSSSRLSLNSSTERMSPLHRAVEEDIESFSDGFHPNWEKLRNMESWFKKNPNEKLLPGKSNWNPEKLAIQDSIWTLILFHRVPQLLDILLRSRTPENKDVCRTWLRIISVFLSSGVTWTRQADDQIKEKILGHAFFQTQCRNELKELRSALKKSRRPSNRFSIKNILGR
ncbi:hypothetical protein EDB81DRAFT_853152 [Dactylonectria macrodidyma]|uniref:NACHT domain-containing protein n=1 Tax=Dactylonectria macrodidyma TaxID=307937 RepID=A0A9P9FLY3_9HYPO|nr:hypothetical protein EDB81DRAFT_853152 [Dactylonectria macrodidyma]